MAGGIVPVRVYLNKDDQRWLTETKYEMGLYIDNVFLMEEEEGTNPFTYHLDTRNLNDGFHIITANIIGYEGEVATESMRVFVKNKS